MIRATIMHIKGRVATLKKPDMAINNLVGNGRSTPMSVNTVVNTGTAYPIIMAMTMTATMMTKIG